MVTPVHSSMPNFSPGNGRARKLLTRSLPGPGDQLSPAVGSATIPVRHHDSPATVLRQADVDQTADLVDGQRDHVGLSAAVCCSGIGGADRKAGEGKGGEAVPRGPAADLVPVKTDLTLSGPPPALRRWTPTVCMPSFRSPVSSTTRTPLGSPSRSTATFADVVTHRVGVPLRPMQPPLHRIRAAMPGLLGHFQQVLIAGRQAGW
jgi:hypothetical protein